MDHRLEWWVGLHGILERLRLSNVLYDCKIELGLGSLGIRAANLIGLLLTPDSGNHGMPACGKSTIIGGSGRDDSPMGQQDIEDMGSDEAATAGEEHASHFVYCCDDVLLQ